MLVGQYISSLIFLVCGRGVGNLTTIFIGGEYMKKILFLIVSCCLISCLGGVVYANDTNFSSNSISVSSTTNPDTSTITTNGSKETSRTENLVIGSSNINVMVKQDNCFTGLDELLNFYIPDVWQPEYRYSLATDLQSLLVDIMSNGGYTLSVFKSAFIEILQRYGIEVNEDFIKAIEQYGSYYFNDDFAQEEEEILLVWIGGTLGLSATLFITSQQGGVHRGY